MEQGTLKNIVSGNTNDCDHDDNLEIVYPLEAEKQMVGTYPGHRLHWHSQRLVILLYFMSAD